MIERAQACDRHTFTVVFFCQSIWFIDFNKYDKEHFQNKLPTLALSSNVLVHNLKIIHSWSVLIHNEDRCGLSHEGVCVEVKTKTIKAIQLHKDKPTLQNKVLES